MVTWLHNGSVAMTTPPNDEVMQNDSITTPPNEVTTASNTTTLVIRNLQPSDAGVYQCVFNDTFDNWILTRNNALCKHSYIVCGSCLAD